MRVTRKQSAANREKVLDVAGTLFRERGFDGIGVADIMKRAGLTHGGFYGQFASKDDLAAEATARVFGKVGWQERQTGKADPSFGDVVRGYLSPRHRDDPGTGCLLAALGSDAARQPRAVRRAFTDGFRLRIAELMKLVPPKDWIIFSHLLIFHGRRVCKARRPLCEECAVEKLCPSSMLKTRKIPK